MSLKKAVIRLAYQKPHLREHLLPLLGERVAKLDQRSTESFLISFLKTPKWEKDKAILRELQNAAKRKMLSYGDIKRFSKRYRIKLTRSQKDALKKVFAKNAWEKALVELIEETGVDIKVVEKTPKYRRMESLEGPGDNGESEWMVFLKDKDAEKYALGYLRDQIEDNPEMFDQSWLANFSEMGTDTAQGFADADAESARDSWESNPHRDDEIIYEAEENTNTKLSGNWEDLEERESELDWDDEEAADKEQEEIWKEQEELVDEAREALSEWVYDSTYEDTLEQLERDPIAYFEDRYSDGASEYMSWLSIDTEAAAQDLIDTDGLGVHLDGYDSDEIALPSGATAFGQN